MKIQNVIFPQPDGSPEPLSSRLWDIDLVDGVVESIQPAGRPVDATDTDVTKDNVASHLLLPTLCHPHLHLDKAYLLTSGCCGADDDSDGVDHPDYSDLLPQTGSFAEALATTRVAKTRFTAADLRRRGLQLLATSFAQGVTDARVFVEVDAQAAGRGTVAVVVTRDLQQLFRGQLAVQVCAFAQEVLFTGAAGAANRAAMEDVLAADHRNGAASLASSASSASEPTQTIAVLGATPYVEATRAQSLQNIDWAVATALQYGLHLDLHLDYNLTEYTGDGSREDAANEPLIFALLEALIRHKWTERARHTGTGGRGSKTQTTTRTVVVGHMTQLTCLPPAQLTRLAAIIRDSRLPVYFVGLPTSDLYMMGRPPPGPAAAASTAPHTIPRGTLPIPALIRDYGLQACLGVNNVGNAFTPHGTGDPLQLACWGVGLYHAGTGPDAHLLYGAVSWRARAAIGIEAGDTLVD
ncbi:zinc metallopeptidase [Sporothrix brasiliensis 5110]|uniref:Zinc metallopeptidase n=1 Tax=Sporothrix brasiliensis 5110 TaxID=1398154 RepID=A0A0C2EVY4_9PEZI|nr:zinc metallopeptidase [Sporothrix brasiliensis 5110]KIH90724.1 zinc metallopeptidase [Sporothrix brasiliensis 5110]